MADDDVGACRHASDLAPLLLRRELDFHELHGLARQGEVELQLQQAPLAAEHLKGTDIQIEVNLGTGGHGSATIWTCDLSAEYVRINGEYRT